MPSSSRPTHLQAPPAHPPPAPRTERQRRALYQPRATPWVTPSPTSGALKARPIESRRRPAPHPPLLANRTFDPVSSRPDPEQAKRAEGGVERPAASPRRLNSALPSPEPLPLFLVTPPPAPQRQRRALYQPRAYRVPSVRIPHAGVGRPGSPPIGSRSAEGAPYSPATAPQPLDTPCTLNTEATQKQTRSPATAGLPPLTARPCRRDTPFPLRGKG